MEGTVRNTCVAKNSPKAYVIGAKRMEEIKIKKLEVRTVRNTCVAKNSPKAYVIGARSDTDTYK